MASVLDRTQKQIESTIPKELKKIYLAIVANGKKLMWSKETHTTMKEYVKEGVQTEEDVPGVVAAGMRGIVRMLLDSSKTKPDMNEPFYAASYPAALVLMCDALEYVEAAKKIEITNDLLADTTKETVAQINTLYGIKKETLDAAMKHTQQKQAEHDANPSAPVKAGAPKVGAAPIEPEV